MKGIAVPVAFLWLVSGAAHANELCRQLRSFERASFEAATPAESNRWIELHWVGAWLDFDAGFGLACRHSADDASRDLCRWLVDNSSLEFASYVPFGMLECRGYSFPRPYPDWSGWQSSITMFGRGERMLVLEVAFGRFESEAALRLSAYPNSAARWRQPLPELEPLDRDAVVIYRGY